MWWLKLVIDNDIEPDVIEVILVVRHSNSLYEISVKPPTTKVLVRMASHHRRVMPDTDTDWRCFAFDIFVKLSIMLSVSGPCLVA